MKKYSISFVLIVLLCVCVMTGCGRFVLNQPASENQPKNKDKQIQEEKTIQIFINGPEYEEAFQQLIHQYESTHPGIKICYETTQNDYPTLLKVRMNSGKTPDIFTTCTGKEIDIYRNWTYDLSEEPLAKAMLPRVAELMKSKSSRTGIYGVALKQNYFGLIYNKRILREAGITEYPKTLSELEEVSRKLAKNGYQPFTTGYGEWWVFKHLWQHFLTAAAESSGKSVQELVQGFENGTENIEDYKELSEYIFNFINLTMLYGDEYPKNTALVNELEAFAQEKAAIMVGQGTWVENRLLELNPDLELGIYGYPVSENPEQCKLIDGVDQAVRVNKDSKNLQEVLDFLNWWYTSEYGRDWFTDVACVIPPIDTEKESGYQLVNEGKAVIEKEGCSQPAICFSSDDFFQYLGNCFQSYVDGKIMKQGVRHNLMKEWPKIDGSANQK